MKTIHAKWLVTACLLLMASVGTTIAQEGVKATKAHSPSRAALMSTILPGLGQAYNKKYWKIPIIYGGLGGMVYLVNYNHDRFKLYHDALIKRTDEDTTTIDDFVNLYTDDNLRTLRDFYRRNRDLSIIVTGAVYALNIIDAAVDAHLFTFDVSDDLTLHLHPQSALFSQKLTPRPAFTLNIRL